MSVLTTTALAAAPEKLALDDPRLPKAKIAIVGGTFVNDTLLLEKGLLTRQFVVQTPAGPSPTIHYGEHGGVPFYYVHGHGGGEDQFLPTWAALSQLGVKEVLGGATAGGINVAMKKYDLVVPDDFMDFNGERPRFFPPGTLKNPPPGIPRFIPPMDPLLRKILLEESRRAVRADRANDDINILERGVLVQAAGGRFESVAEVQFFKQGGGDVVTLNVGTEIAYARQLGINYACLIVISNPAEGIAPWGWADIKDVYPRMNPLCLKILLSALPRVAALPPGPRAGDEQRLHPEFTVKDQR